MLQKLIAPVVFFRNYSKFNKMPLKFAPNLGWMFQEISEPEKRYIAASKAGFKGVESSLPYDMPLEKLVKAKQSADIEQVLINAAIGDFTAGNRGLAAVPNRKQEFKEKLELSIQYATALNCKRIHIMAGLRHESDENTYLENLKYAADRLQKEGILALIEPINTKVSVPGYFLETCQQAVQYIKTIDHPNLKLQVDLFHLQIMSGNLTSNIKEYMPYIGHMQVSQVPDRHEPDTPGEIDYRYILKTINNLGYDGWIGLEYKPKGDTVEGLSWMKNMGY